MSAPSIIQDGSRVAVVGSQVLGVFIVIFTVLTRQEELHSWRPTGTKTQPIAREDENRDKFARLWEDPLEGLPTFQVGAFLPSPTPGAAPAQSRSPTPTLPTATETPAPNVMAAQSPSPTPTPTATETPSQGKPRPGPLAWGSVKYTFLWNIVDARPLPETTEQRLRIRYALDSAILAEGYLPLRESILSPLFDADSEKLPVKDRNLIGRFETFCKATPGHADQWPCVAVIWTSKQTTNLPIDRSKLTWIKNAISKRDKSNVSLPAGDGDVWFLHHGDSDDLSNFSAELVAAKKGPPDHVSFLRATVPLERLPKPPPKDWKSLQKITTDDVLVASLVKELSLRIPALNHPQEKPRIVVFTESDTTYSRAITKGLRRQLKRNAALEIYSYLRALDGIPDEPRVHDTAGTSNSQDNPASVLQSADSLLQREAISEASSGSSQFDYLRRTALDLRGKQKSNVVAVGILGSDIYDKMLVLQAVRPALPSAIFFTTDLDALYLERAMEPFARGLVVASADDLDVNESGEAANNGWKLPLMRDSYQTVLIKHVRSILKLNEPSKSPAKARIFEIAAGKRVELADLGMRSWALWCLAQCVLIFLPTLGIAFLILLAVMSSWALWCLAQGWFNFLIFLPALGNAFLILWAVTTRKEVEVKSPSGPIKKWPMSEWAQMVVYREATLAGLGLLFLFVMLIFSRLELLFGEPLSLGISIWPSVMIRLLAFAVAILLLCVASHSFARYVLGQKDRLKEVLGAETKTPFIANESESLPLHLTRYIRLRIRRITRPPTESGEPDADSIDDFFDWSMLRWWVVMLSILYLLISFVLFWLWPPMVPARGGPAFFIEKIVLALGVALYIVHLIFCLVLHFNAGEVLHRIRKYFSSEDEETAGTQIDLTQMLTSLGTLTTVIGKTLLYPLTVLILIILSRLDIFDNWVMTWSLLITFALGAIVLIGASLSLWWEGAKLKRAVLAQSRYPAERAALNAVNDGVFAAWYSQPIFSAILSVLAVFGSLSVAGPLAKLLF